MEVGEERYIQEPTGWNGLDYPISYRWGFFTGYGMSSGAATNPLVVRSGENIYSANIDGIKPQTITKEMSVIGITTLNRITVKRSDSGSAETGNVITWERNDTYGSQIYQVFRSDTEDGVYEEIYRGKIDYSSKYNYGSPYVYSYTDTDAEAGIEYWYKVRPLFAVYNDETQKWDYVEELMGVVQDYSLPASVGSYILGDVNDDGKVNVLDVLVLQKYLANPKSVNVVASNTDINGDGKKNVLDVLVLQKHIANPKSVTLLGVNAVLESSTPVSHDADSDDARLQAGTGQVILLVRKQILNVPVYVVKI